jgi:hypothetical protein
MVRGMQNLFLQGPTAKYKHINDYIGDIKANPYEKPYPDNGVTLRGSTVIFSHLVVHSLLCKPQVERASEAVTNKLICEARGKNLAHWFDARAIIREYRLLKAIVPAPYIETATQRSPLMPPSFPPPETV